MRRLDAALAAAALLLSAGASGAATTPADRFREAGELVGRGDAVQGIAIYRGLAASGLESASLYWNWAQAASSRGESGEAMWAVLRGREADPGDRALEREIERLREAANLDPAEIAPEPLGVLSRISRRFHLGWLALALAAVSVVIHACVRLLPTRGWPSPAAWTSAALAVLVAAGPLAGGLARSTGVVVRRDAPLLDAASPTAHALGSLRRGEVVPLFEESAEYLRVEDSSGARGWARRDDVWRLDRPPSDGRPGLPGPAS